MKTLLIIGGTGFFGNSLLKYFSNSDILKKKFKKIIILSRSKLKKLDYLKKLKKDYEIVKINNDILNSKKIPYADYVIYAAILSDYKKDYLAVKNYIRLAKIYHRNSKILYTSSGAVYGVQKKKIKSFKEDHLNSKKIIDFSSGYKKSYAKFKIKSEKLFQELGALGIEVCIARCFTFVGEFLPLNSNFVIGNFIKNILDNKTITVKANYTVNRSYMYSDDLVRWLIKILDNSNTSCPIYNVGSDDKISIKKIANILSKKYHLNKIVPKLSEKFQDNYVPNITKARKKLKLKNKYTSMQAIFKTIKLYTKSLKHQ